MLKMPTIKSRISPSGRNKSPYLQSLWFHRTTSRACAHITTTLSPLSSFSYIHLAFVLVLLHFTYTPSLSRERSRVNYHQEHTCGKCSRSTIPVRQLSDTNQETQHPPSSPLYTRNNSRTPRLFVTAQPVQRVFSAQTLRPRCIFAISYSNILPLLPLPLSTLCTRFYLNS